MKRKQGERAITHLNIAMTLWVCLPSIDYDDDPNKVERFWGNWFSEKFHKFKTVGRPLQEVGEPSLFKYLLDGSRHFIIKNDDIANLLWNKNPYAKDLEKYNE